MLLSGAAFAGVDEAERWITRPPADRVSYERRGTALDKGSVFEVVVSKFDSVHTLFLYAEPFVAITEEQAKIYVGEAYRCPKGKRPYLVRALFISGGTGGFTVYQWDKNIWVFHGCLGGGGGLNKSAVVVNLEFNLAKVYVSAEVSDQ